MCSWSAVVFPLFLWLLQLIFIAYAILLFAYLINSGIPVKRVKGLIESSECICHNGYVVGIELDSGDGGGERMNNTYHHHYHFI